MNFKIEYKLIFYVILCKVFKEKRKIKAMFIFNLYFLIICISNIHFKIKYKLIFFTINCEINMQKCDISIYILTILLIGF